MAGKGGRLGAMLPYGGIPVIALALVALRLGHVDGFVLVLRVLLAAFGYVAMLTDLREKRIPNALVRVMLGAWAAVFVPQLFVRTEAALALLQDSALGFAVAGGLFLTVYWISRGGMGGGDVKFIAAAGLYLGLGGVLPAIFIGSVAAGLFSAVLLVLKKIGTKDSIPLAPFLYIGILVTLFLT